MYSAIRHWLTNLPLASTQRSDELAQGVGQVCLQAGDTREEEAIG